MDNTAANGFVRRYTQSLGDRLPFSEIINNEIDPVIVLFANGRRPSEQQIAQITNRIKKKLVDPYFGVKIDRINQETRINFFQVLVTEFDGKKHQTISANQLTLHRRRLSVGYRHFPMFFSNHAIFRVFNREFYEADASAAIHASEYEPAVFISTLVALMYLGKEKVIPIAVPFKKGLFLGIIEYDVIDEIEGATLNVGNQSQSIEVSSFVAQSQKFVDAMHNRRETIGVLPTVGLPNITIKTYVDYDLLAPGQEELYSLLHSQFNKYRSHFMNFMNSFLFFTTQEEFENKSAIVSEMMYKILNSEVWKNNVILG